MVTRVDVTMFRPGPQLALGALLAPALVGTTAGAVAFNSSGDIPVWLPLSLLVWMMFLPLVWLALKSVRVDAHAIATARPWQRWREIAWMDVSSARYRLGSIVIVGAQGERLTFMLPLLRDGARLERTLLLRLPTHVLRGVLRERAQRLIIGDIFPTPHGGLTGMLRARPRTRWRLIAAVLMVAAAVGAYASVRLLTGWLGVGIAVPMVALALLFLSIEYWLSQSLYISEHGVEIAWPFRTKIAGMRWQEIELIEMTGGERILRLRSKRRLVCPGPRLLHPADCNAMRAFIHEYCLQRKVPLVRRRWLI